MERIETQLGTLQLEEGYSKTRLKAELRGMELLCTIVNSTPVWSFNLSSDKPFLCSNDDGPTIQIDVFQCIRQNCEDFDAHLSVYMSQRPVCILKDDNSIDTPTTDSIISLVLLGMAGWPLESTPSTLKEKALKSGSYELHDITKMLPADFEDVQKAIGLYELGVEHASLSALGQLARRWYVCRNWDVEKIRDTLKPILDLYQQEEIENYLRVPDERSDRLFLLV